MAQQWISTVVNDAKGLSFLAGAATSYATVYAKQKWDQYQARTKMERLDFLDRMNVSLNVVTGDHLLIRTIFERPLETIVPNLHAREVLLACAAHSLKARDPVVRLPDSQRWFILNCVLNAIAEQFSAGTLRVDCGADVKPTKYVFCLTCEPADEQRVQKIRVMLIRKDALGEVTSWKATPALEEQKHAERVKTLQTVAALYTTDPGLFRTIEICP